MKLKALYLILFCLMSIQLAAQSTGSLDTTFNVQGPIKGKKPFVNPNSGGRAITYDLKNRILVLACSTYASKIYVNRILDDGTEDKFKNGTGTAIITDTLYTGASCLAVQPDGKILIGGYRVTASTKDMMVTRLNDDGTMDNTFGVNGRWTGNFTGDDFVNSLAVQSNGNIVVAGSLGNRICVTALTSDGKLYTKFNKGGSYISTNTYTEAQTDLKLYNDTIIVSGNFYNSSSYLYTVIKLDKEGYADPSFNKSGRKDFQTPYSSTDNTAAGLYIYPDGNILVGGNTYSSFKVVKLLKYGVIDDKFGVNGVANLPMSSSFPTASKIVLDKKSNIYILGNDLSNFIAARFKPTGQIDSSFFGNGKLSVSVSNTSVYSSRYTLSKDQNLLVTSDDQNTYVAKLSLRSAMVLLGKDYVLAGTGETYAVQVPLTWDYIYNWDYSGTGTYFFPDAEGKVVYLFFTENATDGTLTCKAGSLLSTSIDVKVNHNPSNANQLAKIKCTNVVTNCESNFINYFHLGSILNDSTGCSPSGYSDFTQSGIADTLVVGGVYSAFLQINNEGLKTYTGIWVDYNNDGRFDGEDEFVANASTDNSIVEINNIILKNKEGYDGPKRLRIRARVDTMFYATDGCPKGGEKGETEDYLIVLNNQPNLDAPEIITPNEDGFNDYFVVRGVKPGQDNKLSIFDRWGDNKFTKENYENDWNGVDDSGKKLLPGTYYYVFYNNGNTIKGFLEIRY